MSERGGASRYRNSSCYLLFPPSLASNLPQYPVSHELSYGRNWNTGRWDEDVGFALVGKVGHFLFSCLKTGAKL